LDPLSQTYYNNQMSNEDKEVYCSTHVPKIGAGHVDQDAMGIKAALNVPKSTQFVNEQIRSVVAYVNYLQESRL
jgi:hypothetical protein